MTEQKRLAWVDAAKGISIILVVMMYAASSVGEDTGQAGILHWIIGFATPFRMPEFFLISGLFLAKVIDRPLLRYTDRRVVHYLYFYALWAVIHIFVKTLVAQANPGLAATELVSAIVQPYGVLWFIYMLAIFSAAAKLFHHLRAPHWLVILVAAGLQMAAITSESYIVTQFAAYFVYFYVGYAAAPMVFKLVDWASDHIAAAIGLLTVWAVVNAALVFNGGFELNPVHLQMGYAALPGVHLVLAIAGGLAICLSAVLLTKLASMAWLTWLGAHSLMVYLAFALPMSFTRIALIRLGLDANINVLSLAVFAVALLSPLVLFWLTERLNIGKFLFARPDWAHLPGTGPEKRARADKPITVPAE